MAKHRRFQREPHTIASLARKQGKRQPRKCVLIVCGGTETEPNYFNALRRELRLGTVDVKVVGTRYDPLNVVDWAIANRRQTAYPFDEVWGVLDAENLAENPSFWKAVDKARGNRIFLAVSNPAFEYWYLLHYRETTQPFNDASHVINALRCFIPDYAKNADVYSLVSQYTDIAIERATRLLANHPDAGQDYPNPSTSVHALVVSLRSIVS